MAMEWELVDAHIHADGLSDRDLATLAEFGVGQVVVCAHDGAIDRTDPTAKAWLAHFDRLLTIEMPRLKKAGLRPLFAMGVHPAHAPWAGLEELLNRLPDYLSLPAVVALGGLGLKTGDERERTVLARQLEMARELRRPVIVAAPPIEPEKGMKPLAKLLKESGVPAERIIVEHVLPGQLGLLQACGFSIALEPSAGRMTAKEIAGIVKQNGAERFVLSSHAGDGPAELLTVPSLIAELTDAGLSSDVLKRIGRDNALRALGRDLAAWER